MAKNLFGTKPSLELMLLYHQLEPEEQNLLKFDLKIGKFLSKHQFFPAPAC